MNRVHYHCPLGCEHPQPFRDRDDTLLCAMCWFFYRRYIVMVLCTPATCD